MAKIRNTQPANDKLGDPERRIGDK